MRVYCFSGYTCWIIEAFLFISVFVHFFSHMTVFPRINATLLDEAVVYDSNGCQEAS